MQRQVSGRVRQGLEGFISGHEQGECARPFQGLKQAWVRFNGFNPVFETAALGLFRSGGVQQADGEGYHIRNGIIIIPKGAHVSAGTVV